MEQKKLMLKSKVFFTFTLVFVMCCLMATSVWAAKKVDFYSSNSAGYIQKMNSQNVCGVDQISSIFGLTQDEALQWVRQTTDFNGVTHARYRQMIQGIPVWGMETVVSKDCTDQVVNINGAVVLDTLKDTGNISGKLDPQSALKQMEENHKKKGANSVWSFSNETYGTYIYVDKNDKAHLAYVVSFFADNETGKPSRPIFFIDAKTGKTLNSFNLLTNATGTGPGGNTKTGQYEYGTDYPGFGVTISGTTYTMNTTNVKTVDLNHGTSGSTAYSYTGPRNTHETINGGYCPLNDAQYFGQVIYDMYQSWYGLPVLPIQLTMKVHYSSNYENAFWDGSSMTFGDGYSTFYPLVCLDVSAHEVSHGFTENHSNLTYSGQSGGINESFSDMAGEAAKYYMRGTNDFKVGFDIFKSSTGALRYMDNPPLDGVSIDNVSEYTGQDVHYSSGIFNKAFYLLATSPGWTTRMAFDVFVKANTDYWTASTTFQQGGQGALSAALDYSYPCSDVVNAFAQVGVTLSCPAAPVANFTGTPLTGGAPLTVNFTDSSTNTPTSWSWNFGDGGTSTVKNPSHVFATQGTYTVALTATNSYGNNTVTKTNYITVTAQQPPVVAFTANKTTVLVGGTVSFTDQSTNTPTSWAWTFNGGTPSTSTAQNPTITYSTLGTYSVTLTATNAAGNNTLTKTNYITVTDTLPITYCTSASTNISDEWIAGVVVADLNHTSSGAYYSDFTSYTTHLTKGSSASLTLTPGYSGTAYNEYWVIWIDYNRNGVFTDTGEAVYSGSGTTAKTGSFTVSTSALTGDTRMRVSMKYNAAPTSCETFTYGEVEDYTANIAAGSGSAPVANFTSNKTTVAIGGTVAFTDTSTNTPTSWSWAFTGGTPSTSTSQNPTITYNTAGTYTVALTATNSYGSNTNTKTAYITVTNSTYCTAASTNTNDEWIARVRIGTIDKSSTKSYYSDFTATSTNLTRGASTTVTLNPGYTGTVYSEAWRLFIDYNKDYDFADTGETVFSKTGTNQQTGSFTVSSTASTGATRLRVTMKYSTYTTACGSFTYGEVEDYTVNIL